MFDFKKILIVVAIISVIIAILVYVNHSGKQVYSVSASAVISDKKTGWGIKRVDNHKQPDISTYMNILNKYDGIAMGNKDKPYVYLSFDSGYEAGYTESLLTTLKNNNVNATFFITAHYLNSKPELVKKIIEDGHILGNHTVNHFSLPDIEDTKIRSEIMDLHTTVYEKFQYEMKFIRPPKGEFSERTLQFTKSLGYTTVMWSFAYDDWDENAQKGDEYAKKKILDNIHNGAVILLHSNSKDNCNVLDYCIKEIKNMGYEFKSLYDFER